MSPFSSFKVPSVELNLNFTFFPRDEAASKLAFQLIIKWLFSSLLSISKGRLLSVLLI